MTSYDDFEFPDGNNSADNPEIPSGPVKATIEQIEEKIGIDLFKSGLEKEDLKCRVMDVAEKSVCGLAPLVHGYVIPYYDMQGKHIPFYRVKLFDHKPKYKQIKNTPNHVYFPPSFNKVFTDTKRKYILITEGEKKAALCCKLGIPAVAFGGVDSWRNRTLLLPKGTEFGAYSYSKELIGAKLPPQTLGLTEEAFSVLATGLEEIIDTCLTYGTQLIICYDTDLEDGVKPEVQRAAANFAFEMTYKGVNTDQIKQLILPPVPDLPKTALDDFILAPNAGEAVFKEILQQCLDKLNAFPEHPSVKNFVNKKLQMPKITRREMQQLALAITANLDARGIRMFSSDEGQSYYFETDTGKLMPVFLNSSQKEAMTESDFGKFMYRTYGIASGPDARLMQWLGTQYVSEGELTDVSPHRIVTAREKDVLRFQISDSEYVKITKDNKKPIECVSNGVDGILFEAGCVEGMDFDELQTEFDKQRDAYAVAGKVENQWAKVLETVRLKEHVKDAEKHRLMISLLYYCSPWLHRWNGTQLPVELVIGEAGSGKSTLCELRLKMITGDPKLRNAPTDLKDWYASVANSGGLHVTDNIQLHDKTLKQKLSDEICRLITEPSPHIEMRKYYTTNDLMRVKVDGVFCFTAVSQPFLNVDLLQRAVLVELDKQQANSNEVVYDSDWKTNQLNAFGGRSGWVAHHLFVLHRFLQLVETEWKDNYYAKHRLINLEQILVTLAKVFGMESDWIPGHLVGATESSIEEADWALEGLCAFVQAQVTAFKGRTDESWNGYTASDIADWAVNNVDYTDCLQITNARRLGRYLQTNKATVSQIAFLRETGKKSNRSIFSIDLKARHKAKSADVTNK